VTAQPRIGLSAATGLCLLAVAGVCLGQTPALPDWGGPAGAAKVVTAQGNVSVIKDTQAWAISAGAWVHPRQEIITGFDGYAELQVADGSRLEVFPNSRLVFRHNAGNLRELLDVWIGRVKVYIHRLNGEPNFNRVRTPTAVISVRGTVFDVIVDLEDDVTAVFVEEGSVAVQHAILPFTEAKVLKAGESIRVYKNSPLAKSRIDKGEVVQRALRALSEWMVLQGPRLGGGAGGAAPGGGVPIGGGPTLPGDTPAPPPPPPAAGPPPPP
jgi:hypothetical protein